MTKNLVLHELSLSPNNVKIRIALSYKGLDYERKPIDGGGFPGDRAKLIELSRQPRTPVLQHGDTVVYDSAGILRYLDANFPDAPTLFSTDYAEMGEIEQWELWARTDLSQPISAIFGQAFAPEQDPAVGERASAQLNDLTAKVEERLAQGSFLVTNHPTGADLACAPMLNLALLSPEAATSHPIAAVFHKLLHLGEKRDNTRAWVKKLMQYDPAFTG